METINVEFDLIARREAAGSIHRLLEALGSSYLEAIPTPDDIARIASFGETLRDIREDKGLSQDALGRMLGLSRMGVSRLELSQKLPREAPHVLRIAAALNCDDTQTAYLLRSFTVDRFFTIVMELENV